MPMLGYATRDFLLAWSSHTSAAGESPDWRTIQHSTAPSGTCWRFVPAATPWRNGLAERVIGMVKRSMRLQLDSGALINFAEMGTLLLRISSIMNARPLSARSY